MQKSLFVAGLDFSITNTELQDLFAPHGEVKSAKVVTDKYSGQSRGFGFVDMDTAEGAKAAIAGLNNTTYKNRSLVVKIKEDKPAGSRGGSTGGNGGGRRSW